MKRTLTGSGRLNTVGIILHFQLLFLADVGIGHSWYHRLGLFLFSAAGRTLMLIHLLVTTRSNIPTE